MNPSFLYKENNYPTLGVEKQKKKLAGIPKKACPGRAKMAIFARPGQAKKA